MWSQPGLFLRRPLVQIVSAAWGWASRNRDFPSQRTGWPQLISECGCLGFAVCPVSHNTWLSLGRRLPLGYLATNGHWFNRIGSLGLRVMAQRSQTIRSMDVPVTGGRALMHNPSPKIFVSRNLWGVFTKCTLCCGSSNVGKCTAFNVIDRVDTWGSNTCTVYLKNSVLQTWINLWNHQRFKLNCSAASLSREREVFQLWKLLNEKECN